MSEALAEFLAGPNPNTLPVSSVGTCSFCKRHGPGPGHECSVWNAHHEETPPPKPEPEVFDRALGKDVPWSQASVLDPFSLARVTIELLRGIEWHQNGGGTYTCPAEGSWTFTKKHWRECGLASVLAHAEATYAALNAPKPYRLTTRKVYRKGRFYESRIYVDNVQVGSIYKALGQWHWTCPLLGNVGSSVERTRSKARRAALEYIWTRLQTYERTVHIESSPIGGFDILVGDVIVGTVREDRYHCWHWRIDPNPFIASRDYGVHERTQQEATNAAVRYVESQLAKS